MDIIDGVPPIRAEKMFLQLLIIASAALIFTSSTSGQGSVPVTPDLVKTVSISELLTVLGDKDIASVFERNRILSGSIDVRGIGFELNPATRRTIEQAGGSELLFIAIERAQPKRTEDIARLQAEYLRLDCQSFVDLDRNIENRQKLIMTLRELLDKFGDPELMQEMAYRKRIRSLEERLVTHEKTLTFLIEKRRSN